jgi:hypothetical protein
MSVNQILASLNKFDDAAVNEVVGMVVLDEELLNHVSGGLIDRSSTLSGWCMSGCLCGYDRY